MSDDEEYGYFQLRKEAKTYISKVFSYDSRNLDPRRNVKMVFESSDHVRVAEIEGSMCLRITGNTRKTQVTAVVSQDDKQIRRISFQTFQTRTGGWIQSVEKQEFTFREGEFSRLLDFLDRIKFIDFSNRNTFQIEDISTGDGPKALIDASDRTILDRIKRLPGEQRSNLLTALQDSLTDEEINILLGRKRGLEEYEAHMAQNDWNEAHWQDFFEREQWVFGYGLDYRIMRQFGREMTVGGGGTDNRDKPVVDFLMSFKDYTVLVEIKKPDTPIFRERRGARAGTWEFSPEFMGAVSQVIEQKAEWLAFARTGEHHDKSGERLLTTRTKNAKTILVIGSKEEFQRKGNSRAANVMHDTFELFRRESRSIDIVTFDELLERAQFITRSK